VAFRLTLGFAGSGLARFARVVAGPGAMLACLGTMLRGGEGRCPGHNPAGAMMILALVLTHPGTAFRGWLMADPAPAARLPALPQILVAPA
jgi:cytochrome b